MTKKNKSFFFKNKLNLKKISVKNLNSIFNKNYNRVCFHRDLNDKHQEMIIYQKKFAFYPPKKNLMTDQSFFIIKGKLMILIFDSKGKILNKVILHKKNNFICRVKKGIYHCDLPLTKNTIHFETNNHAFNKRKIKFLDRKYFKNLDKLLSKFKKI